jgi:AraC family transcriptional regulator
MEPRIETIKEKVLIGKRLSMSLAMNKTGELWRNFMPKRAEIKATVTTDLISMNVYPPHYFERFDPHTTFEKWAAVEVSSVASLPPDMESCTLPGGDYAVFHYKGSSADSGIFQYIYGTWLPASKYRLDHRPHFEVLGEKYKTNNPASEEEIWIPIKERALGG